MTRNIKSPVPYSHSLQGFSLIEMLIVTSIMLLLLAVSLLSLNTVAMSARLTTTVQDVMNQLSLARQVALTRNTAVEVRLYKLPDYNQPMLSSPTVYRGMQIFVQDIDGNSTPLDKPVYFQSRIICIDNPTLSSLFATTSETTPTNGPNLGLIGNNYLYRSLRFKSGGNTDQPVNSLPSITFKTETDPDLVNNLPANYVTIQIDSITGRVRNFRP
jgi:uncharacterized protein (TIGR02596 family)